MSTTYYEDLFDETKYVGDVTSAIFDKILRKTGGDLIVGRSSETEVVEEAIRNVINDDYADSSHGLEGYVEYGSYRWEDIDENDLRMIYGITKNFIEDMPRKPKSILLKKKKESFKKRKFKDYLKEDCSLSNPLVGPIGKNPTADLSNSEFESNSARIKPGESLPLYQDIANMKKSSSYIFPLHERAASNFKRLMEGTSIRNKKEKIYEEYKKGIINRSSAILKLKELGFVEKEINSFLNPTFGKLKEAEVKDMYGYSKKEWDDLSDDKKKSIIKKHDEELLGQKEDKELVNIRQLKEGAGAQLWVEMDDWLVSETRSRHNRYMLYARNVRMGDYYNSVDYRDLYDAEIEYIFVGHISGLDGFRGGDNLNNLNFDESDDEGSDLKWSMGYGSSMPAEMPSMELLAYSTEGEYNPISVRVLPSKHMITFYEDFKDEMNAEDMYDNIDEDYYDDEAINDDSNFPKHIEESHKRIMTSSLREANALSNRIEKFANDFVKLLTTGKYAENGTAVLKGPTEGIKRSIIDECNVWLTECDEIDEREMVDNLIDSYAGRDYVSRDDFFKIRQMASNLVNSCKMNENDSSKSVENKIKTRIKSDTISKKKAIKSLMDSGWSRKFAIQRIDQWEKETHEYVNDSFEKDIKSLVIQAFEKYDWDYKLLDDVTNLAIQELKDEIGLSVSDIKDITTKAGIIS